MKKSRLEARMPGSQAAKAKSHGDLTPAQLEHLRKNHLTIRFNKEKDLVEIGWACACNDKSCEAPHTTVAFYSCPYRPCPPTS